MNYNFPLFHQYWFLLYPLLIWSLIWKGMALWRSARNGQKYWFIALLIVNTVGILEIIYLKFFAKCVCCPEKKPTD